MHLVCETRTGKKDGRHCAPNPLNIRTPPRGHQQQSNSSDALALFCMYMWTRCNELARFYLLHALRPCSTLHIRYWIGKQGVVHNALAILIHSIERIRVAFTRSKMGNTTYYEVQRPQKSESLSLSSVPIYIRQPTTQYTDIT